MNLRILLLDIVKMIFYTFCMCNFMLSKYLICVIEKLINILHFLMHDFADGSQLVNR